MMFQAGSFLLCCCFLAPSSLDNVRQESLQQCGLQPPISPTTDCGHRQFWHRSAKLFVTPLDDNTDDGRPPAPPATPSENWLYPYFGSIVDTIESHVTKDRSSMNLLGQNSSVYILQEGFLPEDRTWMEYVRVVRMVRKSQVLYRPKIVEDLVQQIEMLLASKRRRGLMVKGPEGVGKSYSLINLTRYLLASGKYWVTIIPNGEDWTSEHSFHKFLLQSVGVDPDEFGLDYDANIDKDFRMLIADIDTILSKHGKKWVFIFDQINRIFARPQFLATEDVTLLPYPFYMMKQILQPGRIISIISASGNNDVSHREKHEGFDVFEHPIPFNQDEIKMLYSEKQMRMAPWDWHDLDYKTGLVPLYLHWWVQDPNGYVSEVLNDIQRSLNKLKHEPKGKRWELSKGSAIQCLLRLSLPHRPAYLDRKFSLVQQSLLDTPYKFGISELFPLVYEEYLAYFWEDLYPYIRKREADCEVLRGRD